MMNEKEKKFLEKLGIAFTTQLLILRPKPERKIKIFSKWEKGR
jgi:hypothetical protein